MSAGGARMQRAAQTIADRGTRIAASPDQLREVQCLADEEAENHSEWADGLTPSEYLLALVDRAQARKRGEAL